ncbi:MAG: anthranilate synthase component I family protein [Methanoregulaceae archaeon]|nr:anthranilate synthase component I family protein [Methanoregulaceae archaeon]
MGTGRGPEGTRLNISADEFCAIAQHQERPLIIPLCLERELPPISPLDTYLGLRSENGFLLESLDGGEKIARYSYIGLNPRLLITLGDEPAVTGDERFVSIASSPRGKTAVDQIRDILSRFRMVNLRAPRYFGGVVGYFAYDLVNDLCPSLKTEEPGKLPVSQFIMTTDSIVFDHVCRKIYIFDSPLLMHESDPAAEYRACRERIDRMGSRLDELCREPSGPAESAPVKVGDIRPGDREAFEDAVRSAKEFIAAGDIFQAVLSREISCPFEGDPFSIYRALRTINPSPYMYYLDFGARTIIGASPEMLVRVEGGKVTTVPIAGTRPRGSDPAEDARLAQELLADEKERAEHIMLVDLARNDIGRVATFGSVRVDGLMEVEKFSHVQHIVSTVSGTLRGNLDCYDAFVSCFPAGTVSGAPKLRAMEIIRDLEGDRRGLYAGAVGYIGFNRTLEFAIAIRTIITEGPFAFTRVGAGIVADSVPENEWAETENKAAAMIRAIRAAGGGDLR